MAHEVRWYFSENGEVKGPLPESELIRLARGGRVLPTEYILREGHQEWLSARPLVENAHALPVDGEVPTARVATQPDLTIGDSGEQGGGVPGFVWALLVVVTLGLGGFTWYMLGPMSPITGQDPSQTNQPAPTSQSGPVAPATEGENDQAGEAAPPAGDEPSGDEPAAPPRTGDM